MAKDVPDDISELLAKLPPIGTTSGLPSMPMHVLNRAGTMLRLAKLGLEDMSVGSQDRAILGLFSVAVFGRAVTSALQNLRTFDRRAFDDWYAPWLSEMNDDPLCRYFYKLRSDVLKGISPIIGYGLASFGPGTPAVGTLNVINRPSPTVHRGQPIKNADVRHLCELYVTYLEEMVTSAASVINAVQDGWKFPGMV